MMEQSQIVTIVVSFSPADRLGPAEAEVELWVGGERVPTGIKGPTPQVAVRLLADRLAGLAP